MQHLAANGNCSEEGNKFAKNVNRSVNKGRNLMAEFILLISSGG